LVCELVSSRNHVQGSSCSGASLPVQQLSLIERTFCPLAVAGTTTHRPRPAATIIPPRLRGFAPHEAALPQFGVNRPTARSPPQVRVSSRCSPASPCAPVSPAQSTHDVTSRSLRSHDDLSQSPPAYSR
jgi:hypothetical protein